MKPYYEHAGITIYVGDAREIIPQLSDEVSFCYADPPYGISIVKTSGVLAGRESSNGWVGGGAAYRIPFGGIVPPTGTVGGTKAFGRVAGGTPGKTKLIESGRYMAVRGDEGSELAKALYRCCSVQFPAAVQVWWGANHYSDVFPASSCWLIWDKENTGQFADAELAYTNRKTAVRIIRHEWNGLLKASERGERRVHPTQKPVVVATWILEKYGAPDDLILDPCFGSGSCLVAAKKLNRRAIGIEICEEYAEIAAKRLAQEVLQLA